MPVAPIAVGSLPIALATPIPIVALGVALAAPVGDCVAVVPVAERRTSALVDIGFTFAAGLGFASGRFHSGSVGALRDMVPAVLEGAVANLPLLLLRFRASLRGFRSGLASIGAVVASFRTSLASFGPIPPGV